MDVKEHSFDQRALEQEESELVSGPSVQVEPDLREELNKGVRSWGIWMILLGLVHLVASGFLSAPWGIMLVLLGLASFFFRAASMYVIYAIVLAWAGISNLLSGSWYWVGFAVLQGVLAFRVLRQFFRFRRAGLVEVMGPDQNGEMDLGAARAYKIFPWAGCLLGGISMASFLGIIGGVVIYAVLSPVAEEMPWENVLDFGLESDLNLAVLAVALGAASLLGRYQRRALAIMGLVSGMLVTVLFLLLALL